jgi:Trk K+ transport system NAD-binding subunit
MADDTQWANAILAQANNGGVQRVIAAINRETHMAHAKLADVIVACAQILGQTVANAPSDPAIAGVPSGGGNDPLDRLMR